MVKVRPGIVAFFVFFIPSAAMTTSASADWFVGGTKLAAGATAGLASTAKVDTASIVRFNFLGVPFRILCKGSTLREEALEIIGINEGRAKSLSLEQCETIEPASRCELVEQPTTIKTQPIKITTTKGPSAPEDRLIISPATKINLAIFEFVESCALREFGINGSVTMRLPTGQTEASEQPLEELGSVENNSAEVGGMKVFLEGGRMLLKLKSGSKWSFH